MASERARDLLDVCGVQVDFPFTPYPCQLVYMEKVIESLQRGTNAILESPTGTGKTLCLLCATLAWREDLIRKQRGYMPREEVEGNEGGWAEDMWDIRSSGGVGTTPKIIYASRTHSQLSQVIHELKNTKYRPRVAIIGSREQMCIHPEVSKKETNFEKVHLCRAKVTSNSCMYQNVDVKRLKNPDPVMDIEDLVLAGTQQRMCPYYLARELQSEADIIFMPYNYILDIKTRKMHNIYIQGTIIILDEAHNIEKVCEESASFDLTSTDISLCISDVDTILKAKVKEQEYSTEEGEMGEDMEDFLNLKSFFLSLEKKMDDLEISSSSTGVVKPGQYIFEFLAPLGLTTETYGSLLAQCGKAIVWLTAESRPLRNGINIEKFMDAVTVVFSHSDMGTSQASSHNYKVFMKTEEAKKIKKSDVWTAPAPETSAKKETKTLSYWCFSPGHTMANLTAQGVRSIILTSGTLSPLDSFSSELHIDFPTQYEGPHVISKQQVWVGVVSHGCDGVPLNSSYTNRFNPKYQSSLGNTIVNFARIVPHGILVFFPSYPVMHSCLEFWRENDIMRRMEQYKPSFQEPKRKADFNSTMDAFYEAINDPKKDGAIFFAVCRGKVSEGLDFANNNGRAVIITGLPYPPRMDPKVDLKMKYLEESQRGRQSVVLGGQEWYKQQASRAVNQAVGRVIRHRHDYGAIILCDERFAYRNTISQLPKWVRPFVQTYDKFGLIQRDLTQFFRNAEKEFGRYCSKKSTVKTAEGRSTNDESSGSGPKLPIVARGNLSWRSRAADPQDASLVETHLASRTASLPQASLKKLRVEEKARGSKSLLNSLEQVEGGAVPSKQPVNLHKKLRPHKVAGPTFSQSILCSQSIQDPAASTSSAVRPKKMLVVSKQKQQVKKVASIAGFIAEMQDNLSDQAYTCFKTALAEYKKKQDIYAFIESLKDVFKQASHFYLLKKLHSFLLEKHKETFALFYCEFTGRELDHQPPLHRLHGRKRNACQLSTIEEPKPKRMVDASAGEATSSHLNTDKLLDPTTYLNHGRGHLSQN